MELVVVYVAPIPIGHRVRITWHALKEAGLGGQVRTDDRPHQPWITDLDTGVEYRTDWAAPAERRRHQDQPYELSDALGMGISVERELTATVKACRVVTVRGYPDLEVQTHLTLDPE